MKLKIENSVIHLPDKLDLSPYVKQMISEFGDVEIPMIGSLNKFNIEIFKKWFTSINNQNYSEYCFIVNEFPKKYFDLDIGNNLENNVELLHFAIANQFISLANIIAKKLCNYSLLFINNKYYISNQKYLISLTEAMMIFCYYIKDNYFEDVLKKCNNNSDCITSNIKLLKNFTKNFKYNPTFEKKYENYFDVQTLIFVDIMDKYETNKNIILYYGPSSFANEKTKIINKILTGSDLNRRLKPEIIDNYIDNHVEEVENYLLKNYKKEYLQVFREYENSKFVCKLLKKYLNEYIVFLKIKQLKNTDYFISNFNEVEYETPDDIWGIDAWTFNKSPNLRYVNISNNVKFIGSFAFYACRSLTEINFSRKLTIISSHILDECRNLKTIKQNGQLGLPYVKTIKGFSFRRCYQLNILDLPNVKEVNFSAFLNCGLTSLTLNTTHDITIYNAKMINDMDNLRELTISSLYLDKILSHISKPLTIYCFGNLTDEQIEKIQNKEDLNFVNYDDKINRLITAKYFKTIPDYIDEIFDGCFENNDKIEYADLTKLKCGERTFKNCINLKTVKFIDSDVNKIMNSCFEGCVNLVSVNLPQAIKTIGMFAFKGCKKLLKINTEHIEFFAKGCFEGCENLEKIKLAKIKSIPELFMKNCNIREITIPENVIFIGKYAFENCKNLQTVNVMSSKITKIQENCFLNCMSLKYVNGFKNVSKIEKSAFENCKNLLSLDCGKLESIAEYAFLNCSSLTKISEYNVDLSKFNVSAFEGCISLKRQF